MWLARLTSFAASAVASDRIANHNARKHSRMTLATEKAWSDGALIDKKLLLGSKEQQGTTEQGLRDVRVMNNFVEAMKLEGKAVVIGRDNHKWRLLLQHSCCNSITTLPTTAYQSTFISFTKRNSPLSPRVIPNQLQWLSAVLR